MPDPRPIHDPTVLPPGPPTPTDDGAADHLLGAALPDLALEGTDGLRHNLAALVATPTVLFFYPRTGVPGQPPGLGPSGEEWDTIPGARGCTPQSCGFRDLHARFLTAGVRVRGVSTSRPAHQREFVSRMHMPFPMLSDCELVLTRAMRLPTFEFSVSDGPSTLIRRMAWFCTRGRIEHVWYPVFPPDANAREVLAWILCRPPEAPR